MPPLPARPALFVDVDGTLLPIADDPDNVFPDPALLRQLAKLHSTFGGALAILSGRTLANLDALLAPLVLPAAGVHGLERRRADGSLVPSLLDYRSLDVARAELGELAQRNPRLVLEDKSIALAVHYRRAPELRGTVVAAMMNLLPRLDHRFHIQPGLDVLEFKPVGSDKGSALRDFMSEAVFRDRRPVVIGDDITDLDAFRAAEEIGGMTIGVGPRISGQWQLSDPQALRRWLTDVA